MTDSSVVFQRARDLLLDLREDYPAAYTRFAWPELDTFNWALDWFDGVLATESPDAVALWVVRDTDTGYADERLTFAGLALRSNQVANWLRSVGVARGDRLILMLGNRIELWETLLAAIKLGAVVIPASTLLTTADLVDRIERGGVRHVVVGAAETARFSGIPGAYTRISVGGAHDGWLSYSGADDAPETFTPDGQTRGDDPLLLYFTSGTTAKPKLVEHTHTSYPVGHLSTMYWIGLRPGDVHLNISSPGWAKHAWSNVFAPWNAGATVLVYDYARFDAGRLTGLLERCEVTSFCAPPTVWRMLIQAELGARPTRLRELVAAGEPLNPEVIAQVGAQWGITIRDGYGQTETTAQIGNPPGASVREGSMGRPLPGYAVALVDLVTGEVGQTGEICLDLSARPLGLMTAYRDSDEKTAEAMRDGFYHTGDVAERDADGYITYVGRSDDVFKASDYRISPFELESALLEHDAVAEAAVVPAPDPVRLAVPKAYVTLAAGHEPSADTALSIMRYTRQVLAPYKRIRRIEFAELPKTISGKIRRVELREAELRAAETSSGTRRADEYRDDDFPQLRAAD